uniref:Uncharacterized protein n=1 Tax=Arundo donax TaxID=35708 RepID=A0A0A9TRS4_ARUDO
MLTQRHEASVKHGKEAKGHQIRI